MTREFYFEACLLVLMGLILLVAPATYAQSTSVPVPQYDFSASSQWTNDGTDSHTANGVCPANNGPYMQLTTPQATYSAFIDIPPAYQDNGSNLSFPLTINGDNGGEVYSYALYYIIADPGSDDSRVNYHTVTSNQWIVWDVLNNPAPIFAIPNGMRYVRVGFQSVGNGTKCVDDIGPVRFTNPNVDCSQADCGATDTTGDDDGEPQGALTQDVIDAINAGDYGNPLDWSFDDGSSDSDFDSAIDDLESFVCGDPLDFIVKKAGGGNLLKKILGFIKSIAASQLGIAEGSMALNCKADVANEIAGDSLTIQNEIYEGQTNITNLPPNANFGGSVWQIDNGTGRTASDAADDTLQGLESGIGSDNAITASARTNRLLVANMRMQAQLSDRLVGSSDRPAYQQEGGALIRPEDVDAEAGADFAEGDYEGTVDKIVGYGRNVEPDYEEIVEVEDADPEFIGTGSCLAATAEAPTGTGSELAFAKMKWNAAQRLAGSNMGNFICSVIDQPPRNATAICLGSDAGFSTSALSGGSSLSNGNFCVYGPDAPAFSNLMFNSLPFILLMFASLSVFKMFFN